MGASNLAGFLDGLAQLIADNSDLSDRIEKLVPSTGPARHEELVGELTKALNQSGANDAWNHVQTVRKEMVQQAKEARSKGDHRLLFLRVRDLLHGLDELEDEFPELGHGYAEVVREQLQELDRAYDTFLAEDSPGSFFTFLLHASESERLLTLTYDQALLASATIGVPRKDDEEVLAVTFQGIEQAGDVADVVGRFERVYSTLAPLLEVDLEQEPLLVAYIEVGSLLSWLRGNSSLIQLVERLLVSFLGYIHRNHTVEGRIGQIPEKAATAHELADLKAKLEEAGMDTSGMEADLEDAATNLADEFSALVRKGSGIVVGDVGLEVEEPAQLEQPDEPYILAPPEEVDDDNEND